MTELMQALQATEAEILRTLNLFHRPGSVDEVRILGIPGRGRPFTAAGYFTNFERAAQQAALYDQSRCPKGIYFTLNAVNPALLARSPDQITEYLDTTTSDADVVRRRWILIDVDPQRPSGIPSSDEELDAARIVASEVRDCLMQEFGFCEPIEAISGNGWHLLFPCDAPNDEATKQATGGLLNSMAGRFGGERTPQGLPRVDIDTSVFNAGRITKLYGTMVRKGHGISGRPLRPSKLIHVPANLDFQTAGGGTNEN